MYSSRRGRKSVPNFKNITKLIQGVFVFVFALCGFVFFVSQTLAEVPPAIINYQGRLRDNTGTPIDVSTTIQFSIYSHTTNGDPGDVPSSVGPLLWKEVYDQGSGSCAQIIPDAQGYFTLNLGSCTAFPSYLDFSTGTYYLALKVGVDAEAAPRVILATHPYAFNSHRVDGFHATSTAAAGQLLALDNNKNFNIVSGTFGGANITLSSTTATSTINGNLRVIGNATFGSLSLDNVSSTNITAGGYLNVSGQTTLANASSTNLTVSTSLFLTSISPGSVVFAGSGGLLSQDNANFFFDDTNNRLGVGTSSPAAKLDVNGDVILSGVGRYINFGSATSSAGYGIRDNAGIMQYKNLSGNWSSFTTKVDHIINVAKEGGDYSELAPAFDAANAFPEDVIVNVYPGVYYVSSTLMVTSTHFKGVRGMSEESTIIRPTTTMVSSPQPVIEIDYPVTTDFGMRLITIDGSQTIGFRDTPGCDAVKISSTGTEWLNFEQITIHSANRAVVMEVANMADFSHSDIHDSGDIGILLNNGASVNMSDSYMEEADNFFVRVLSNSGSSTFYMVGSEFGSYLGVGTGIQLEGNNSYVEVRYSNLWGLDYNVRTYNASHINITNSYLQTAVSKSIDQHNTSRITAAASNGAFAAADMTIENAANVYFNTVSESDQMLLLGKGVDVDQDIFQVYAGKSSDPRLSYRSNYYYGIQGLIYSDLTPGSQGFLGVESEGSTASIFASDKNRDSQVQLGLFSALNPGVYDDIRGWNINRRGADAKLNFTFINSDVGDSKAYITSTDVMTLDGFNQMLLVDGGAVFNSSSGNFDFQVKGQSNVNLFFADASGNKVGIGTSTPTYDLTVAGGVNVTDNYYVNGVPVTTVNAGSLTGQTLYWNGSAFAPTSSIFVTANGFVGIGTTTPANRLSITGGIYLASSSPANTAYAFYNYGGQLYWNGNPLLSGGTSSFIADINNDTAVKTEHNPNEDKIRFDTNGVERMIIDETGKVGIGTSTPGFLLTVIGTSSLRTILPQENLSYDFGSSILRWNNAWVSALNVGSVTSSALSVNSLGVFNISTPGSSTPAVSVTGGGFIGIATVAPLAQLDVNGNMVLSGSNRYLNFSSATGSEVYGIRDNAGIMEVKHGTSSDWTEIITDFAIDESNVIFVRGNGNDANDGDCIANPVKTIQAGIALAAALASSTNPYVVNIGAGTYTENFAMADYVRVVGNGRETIVKGTVTYNNSNTSVLADLEIDSTNTYAVTVSSTDGVVFKNVVLNSTYSNDAAVQSVVQVNRGTVYVENSDLKLIRSDNAAGVKQNTIFHVTGPSLVRLNVLNDTQTVQTSDNDDDVSILYVDNTNVATTLVNKDGNVIYSLYGSAPNNSVKNIYHNGSKANSYVDGTLIAPIAILSGTPKFFMAYVANSEVSSGVRVSASTVNWSGFADGDVYLGSAQDTNDTLSIVSTHFGTANDVFPERYTVAGASGTVDFQITNGHGNIKNTAFATFNGSFGIGTSTPHDLLEVWGSDLSSSPTSSRNYVTIVANGNGEAGNYIRRVNSGAYNNGWSWYMPTSSLDFRLWDDSIGGSGGDDVLTVQAGTARLGIGRALYDPLNTLHVDGGIYLASSTSATSSNSLYNTAGALYWNGNLLMAANGAMANWVMTTNFNTNVLSTSTTIPVWFKDVIYASSSLYMDGILLVSGTSTLATTSITDLTVDNINVLGAVSTTNILVANNITLGGVTRNTWPNGGGGDSVWSTTSLNVTYPGLAGDYAVVIGNSVTSSNVKFEVDGASKFGGAVQIVGAITGDNNLNIFGTSTLATTTASDFTATALTFTSASGSSLTASGFVSSSQLFISNTSTLGGPVKLGGWAQFTTVGDNYLYFKNGTSNYLKWDNTNGRFELSNGLNVAGTVTSTGLVVSGNSNLGTVTAGTWNGTVIGTNYGGSGTTTLGASGSVLYSNGSSYAYTATGTVGYLLQANASGAPTWISTSSLGLPVGSGSSGYLTFWNATTSLSGSSSLYWDDTNGRLGVGTSTPSSLISLYSSAGPQIGFSNGVLDGYVGINSAGPTLNVGTNNAFPVIINTNNTERLRVDSTGKVGIGTSTPSAFLSLFTNNTTVFDIASTTGINLLEAKNLSTNFGMSVESGAFIDRNSYFGEEFTKGYSINADGAAANFGDTTAWITGETGTCTWTTNDQIGGVSVTTVGTADDVCTAYIADPRATSASLIFSAANLPVVVQKLRVSTNGAVPDDNHYFWSGLSNFGTVAATEGAAVDTVSGLWFSNCSSINQESSAGTDCGANLYGVARNGSDANTSVTASCGAIDPTKFMYLMIKVISTTQVEYWVDMDVSNGVSPTLCDTLTTNITANPLSGFIGSARDQGANSTVLENDFFRVWQDDSPSSVGLVWEDSTTTTEQIIELSFEEKTALALEILSSAVSSTAGQMADLAKLMNDGVVQMAVANDHLGILSGRADVLDTTASTTASMLAGLDARVVVLENSVSTTDNNLVIIRDQISDIQNKILNIPTSTVADALQGNAMVFDANSVQSLVVENPVEFKGKIFVKDQITLGVDSVGQAKILSGATSTAITFVNSYENLPIITVTPVGLHNIVYGVDNITTSSFNIMIDPVQNADIIFNWHAFGSTPESKIFVSDGTTSTVNVIVVESRPLVVPEIVVPITAPNESQDTAAVVPSEPAVAVETPMASVENPVNDSVDATVVDSSAAEESVIEPTPTEIPVSIPEPTPSAESAAPVSEPSVPVSAETTPAAPAEQSSPATL